VTGGWQTHPSLDVLSSLLSGISSKDYESWESLTSKVSSAFWGGGGGAPNHLIPDGACLLSFCWSSGLQSISLPNTRSVSPLPSNPHYLFTFPNRSLPPYHIWLISSLSQVRLRHPHLGNSTCCAVPVLLTVCSVFCIIIIIIIIIIINWLISTY
jgi:hypothetical protein